MGKWINIPVYTTFKILHSYNRVFFDTISGDFSSVGVEGEGTIRDVHFIETITQSEQYVTIWLSFT